ncbi:MAG: hypothetical protein HN580_01790 [Deltaproteobacteria bacterium]|nr:hypothetical protein [Deltaproteobacteria bacterium]MBT4637799.1 hypothetical protein [Deltaproteobacteria bacterium]MBT6498745.1 hypothetical protein [Deltaproteobacteria bacterium]MBT6616100.1 hypothetical protein [Deltaproteobacteria bacterium]MBT7716696.1 hypothetical protein [Deltaproteobacteria bacterium]
MDKIWHRRKSIDDIQRYHLLFSGSPGGFRVASACSIIDELLIGLCENPKK